MTMREFFGWLLVGLGVWLFAEMAQAHEYGEVHDDSMYQEELSCVQMTDDIPRWRLINDHHGTTHFYRPYDEGGGYEDFGVHEEDVVGEYAVEEYCWPDDAVSSARWRR